jgi:hypothetical protein
MKPIWCKIYSHYISSILFITSTCFGPLQVHRQEEQLYLCDTWYYVILYSWLSGVQDGMIKFHPAYQIAKYTEYCAPNWFHLQNYTEIHDQENKFFQVHICKF